MLRSKDKIGSLPRFTTVDRENGQLHISIYDTNTKRDYVYDVYIIFYWIKLTILTICAFLELNPRQWSFAKQSS